MDVSTFIYLLSARVSQPFHGSRVFLGHQLSRSLSLNLDLASQIRERRATETAEASRHPPLSDMRAAIQVCLMQPRSRLAVFGRAAVPARLAGDLTRAEPSGAHEAQCKLMIKRYKAELAQASAGV